MGKSTLMERITLHMARRSLNQPDPDMPKADYFNVSLTPILITLAHYATKRRQQPNLSIYAYLKIALQELQIPEIETVIYKALANRRS